MRTRRRHARSARYIYQVNGVLYEWQNDIDASYFFWRAHVRRRFQRCQLMNGKIIQFSVAELAGRSSESVPVAAPIGTPVSEVRSQSVGVPSSPTTRMGVWQCSPGRWRRQVKQAEFSHFLEGDCTFTPDGGEPIVIRAGDAVYFPANSAGIWDIRSATRKIFIILDGNTPT
jgi:uncharacterized cupin superfamily protein